MAAADAVDREYTDSRLPGLPIHVVTTERSLARGLVVLMPSALSRDQVEGVPIFSRWTWRDDWPDADVMAFADPALAQAYQLRGAWFMHPDFDVLAAIAAIVAEHVARRHIPADRVVFYGSSLGGFGAIAAAAHLRGARAVAEVPQIDFGNWFPGAIRMAETHIFGEPLAAYRARKPEQVRLHDRIKAARHAPPTTIISNRDDLCWADQVQFIRWLRERHPAPRGTYQLIETPDVPGHAVLARPQAVAHVNAMMEGGEEGRARRPRFRVAIFGSCVSRDTLRYRSSEDFAIVSYWARQSLLSWGTDARPHLPESFSTTSAFQRRQIEWDANGEVDQRLADVADRVALLLWDLVDERHGVVRFPDGTFITRSVDILATPELRAMLDDGESLAFGTDEHFHAWRHAADRFVDLLRRLDLLERTLLVATPWATRTHEGEPAPVSMGVTAEQANERYARYYAHLDALGVRSVSPTDPVADPVHKWGPAPFHYHHSVYDVVNEDIDRFLEEFGHP